MISTLDMLQLCGKKYKIFLLDFNLIRIYFLLINHIRPDLKKILTNK
jgi:hypothetical protein